MQRAEEISIVLQPCNGFPNWFGEPDRKQILY